MPNPRNESDQEGVLRRWQAMGLHARLMEGGRCVIAALALSKQPFEGLAGSRAIPRVLFASVGVDRIKCLRPRALFQLPMIRVLDCGDAAAIEARIRSAWQKHVTSLARTQGWLDSLGIEPTLCEDGSVLAFGIEGEDPSTQARLVEPRHVLLPGRGPLRGIALPSSREREYEVAPEVASGIELEIGISNRLEELARADCDRAEAARRRAIEAEEPSKEVVEEHRPHRILVVGPRLSKERACLESLRYRGYQIDAVSGEPQALAALARWSPGLVLSDVDLDRSGGLELILALREVAGIEELPVVLVDSQRRSSRRDLARQVGAAGYLVHPIDVARIAERLADLVEGGKRRRFTRYPRRLSVEIAGARGGALTTSLGRGGMFIATDENLPARTIRECRISLPELGRVLRVQAEPRYRVGNPGAERRGHGLRFRSFEDGGEPLLIDYLQTLGESES